MTHESIANADIKTPSLVIQVVAQSPSLFLVRFLPLFALISESSIIAPAAAKHVPMPSLCRGEHVCDSVGTLGRHP
jgi:hypothetical protein